MGALSTIALAGVTAAQTLGQAGAQRQAAKVAEEQGRLEQAIAIRNAEQARLQAQDARRRGETEAGRYRASARGMIGAQRAGFAAQGIDLSTGSAQDVVQETHAMSELDVLQIRNNAALEAWGYETAATDAEFRGLMARRAGDNQASALRAQSWNTLLTGGADMMMQARMWGGSKSQQVNTLKLPKKPPSLARIHSQPQVALRPRPLPSVPTRGR